MADFKIVLGNKNYSSWSLRGWLALKRCGVPFDEESKSAIARYQEDHPRGRFGRVRYDLADFDLDAGELRERFRFYTDRFPVRLES